jgi:hypothetical protein
MKRLLLLLVSAFALLAADANMPPGGVWKATVASPDGSQAEITYDLHVSGGGVSGTIYTSLGEMHIVEGKVDGNKITFTAEFADSQVTHEGTFTATEMQLVSTMMNQKTSLVLKKAK